MFDNPSIEYEGVLYGRLVYLIYGIFWLLGSLWIAQKIQFYTLPAYREKVFPSSFLFQMVGAFLVFFCIEVLLLPLYMVIWLKVQNAEKLDPAITGWLTLLAMIFGSLGVLLYCFFLPAETKNILKGSNGKGPLTQKIKDFIAGVFTWVFAFPAVIVWGQLIAIIVFLITKKIQVDQTVVKHLKNILQNPFLFFSTIAAVVSIVPIVEEILFRGFLQSWLVPLLGRIKAIILTSFIFASFHFSTAQGIANFELLSSLFILSCFLGFIYEKQQSLWAPIGLHAIFNTIGVISVYFSSN